MRLDIERQHRLEPRRMDYCERTLTNMGFDVVRVNSTELNFMHRGSLVRLWPYSGWHTGKTVRDGRGFAHLREQLTSSNEA